MAQTNFEVRVHTGFESPTPFACAYERGDPSFNNALVFIGGLTTGPHSTPALEAIDIALRKATPQAEYGLWELQMRSSYTGFGYSSLANDAEDLAAFVKYLRRLGKEKIVLLGSSTGCQDIMEYSKVNSNSTPVNGYILQAPTSDRETAGLLMPPDFFSKTLQHAEEMIARGDAEEVMLKWAIPPIFSSPLTAYRWHSLIAKGGDDDFFSSDLADEMLRETFGKLDKASMILPSENDEMVPPTVDKAALLQRWIRASPKGIVSSLSDLNPGADHALSQADAREWVAERVIKFLESL